MAFDNPAFNATLITSGEAPESLATAPLGTITGDVGTVDHVVITNGAGNTMSGDYTIENFGKNDTILTTKKIFDGNNDGIINFGPNAVLDTERTGGGVSKAGDTQVNVIGEGGDAVLGIRYLGSKDGYFVYADASVRLAGFTEGFVTDDVFDATAGDVNIFFDNALGLNLGADTINGFGAGDKVTFTSELFDRDGDGIVKFGANGVLDVSGDDGPLATDPADADTATFDAGDHPGGQIAFTGLTEIKALGFYEVGGVTYYEYGIVA